MSTKYINRSSAIYFSSWYIITFTLITILEQNIFQSQMFIVTFSFPWMIQFRISKYSQVSNGNLQKTALDLPTFATPCNPTLPSNDSSVDSQRLSTGVRIRTSIQRWVATCAFKVGETQVLVELTLWPLVRGTKFWTSIEISWYPINSF